MNLNRFMSTAAGSLLKIFLAAIIPLAIECATTSGDIFTCIAENWRVWASAGLVSVLIFGYNYLNPHDPRYGKK